MGAGGMKRISKELREEILDLYLRDAMAGTQLAMEHGLTGAYAYKLANARGLLPLTRHVRVNSNPESTGHRDGI
jgi:transposase-like protein